MGLTEPDPTDEILPADHPTLHSRTMMTVDREPPVTRRPRPPVRQATLVRSTIDHNFEVFVAPLGVWWPGCPFSAGQNRVRDVTLEQRVGGRVYETWQDGTVVAWGELLDWRPPERFTMTWTETPEPTEVELTFVALGQALTRVTVEHRGWDALSDAQLSQDCALPGGHASGGYQQGWTTILSCLTSPPRRRPPIPGDHAVVTAEHVAYWQSLADKDIAVVFGPVADPGGAWGVAVVEADTADDVRAIRSADPVVTSDLGPVHVCPMPAAITRGAQSKFQPNVGR